MFISCSQDGNNDIYYFNFSTGESRWDHPCDDYYRDMVTKEKQKQTATGSYIEYIPRIAMQQRDLSK